MIGLAEGIPIGTWDRLVDHYGAPVRTWLHEAERMMVGTAARSRITIAGFHDAGWTSAIALGHYRSGQPVILKAFPYLDRYQRERAALMHWAGRSASRLLGSDDQTKMLVIELIGDAPGGSSHPADDAERIADALPNLHRIEVGSDSSNAVPVLCDYYRRKVLPRIEERSTHCEKLIGERTVRRALALGAELCATRQRHSMLHTDLYAENVLFNTDHAPVFIDPHPKIGPPAFDWAFWCVYYRQDGGFSTRAALSRLRVPDLADEILAWSITIAVDGALCYSENNEPGNVTAMQQVLSSPELEHLV